MDKPQFFLEPETSFLALNFYLGARAEFFGSGFLLLGLEPSFLALNFFGGTRAELFALNFY